MFILRDVRLEDLDELEILARHLNTVNLPANRERLEELIRASQESFRGERPGQKEREYVFVLCDMALGRVVGTGMIIAQHGTFRRPSVYFNVQREQKYSETLDRHFVHEVLQLSFNYEGPTEIGGLIVHPDYQGHPRKLGKILSFGRFLYMGLHREDFRNQIIAELLPPLNPDGSSDLWECLGANFTGLDYTTADKLSRQNVEFIRSLFPTTPIYTALLPTNVREKIGQVGPSTLPVERMLTSIGFRYDNSIDPFDGGPTFAVETDACELIKRTHIGHFQELLAPGVGAEGHALVTRDIPTRARGHFEAALVELATASKGCALRGPELETLGFAGEEPFGLMPLGGLYSPPA